MARRIRLNWQRIERSPAMDVIGGVWLVTLLSAMLHLPSVVG